MQSEDFWAICCIAGIVAILVSCAAYGTSTALATQECLSLGWPSARVDLTLKQYCVKRVDQTDEVRPLKELRGGPNAR